MIYDSSCVQSLFTHLWEVCGRLQRELSVWDQVMRGERLLVISSKLHLEDFPGGPVAGTLLFQFRGPRFYPWSGTRPHGPQLKSCMPQLKQTNKTNQPTNQKTRTSELQMGFLDLGFGSAGEIHTHVYNEGFMSWVWLLLKPVCKVKS